MLKIDCAKLTWPELIAKIIAAAEHHKVSSKKKEVVVSVYNVSNSFCTKLFGAHDELIPALGGSLKWIKVNVLDSDGNEEVQFCYF